MPITKAINHNGITVTTAKEIAFDDTVTGDSVGWQFQATGNDVNVFVNGSLNPIRISAGGDPFTYWAIRGQVQLLEFQAVGGDATFDAKSVGV